MLPIQASAPSAVSGHARRHQATHPPAAARCCFVGPTHRQHSCCSSRRNTLVPPPAAAKGPSEGERALPEVVIDASSALATATGAVGGAALGAAIGSTSGGDPVAGAALLCSAGACLGALAGGELLGRPGTNTNTSIGVGATIIGPIGAATATALSSGGVLLGTQAAAFLGGAAGAAAGALAGEITRVVVNARAARQAAAEAAAMDAAEEEARRPTAPPLLSENPSGIITAGDTGVPTAAKQFTSEQGTIRGGGSDSSRNGIERDTTDRQQEGRRYDEITQQAVREVEAAHAASAVGPEDASAQERKRAGQAADE